MNDFIYGFSVTGGKDKERVPIEHALFLQRASECDSRIIDVESYISHFQFDAAFYHYIEQKGTTKEFRGRCYCDYLFWDIDRTNDIEKARQDTSKLCENLITKYKISDDEILVFFSGAKGFHVGIHTGLIQPTASAEFNKIARQFAIARARECGFGIDESVYDQLRLYRTPNSIHPKTKLHKYWLSVDELFRLSVEDISRLAGQPIEFNWPVSTPNEIAIADWVTAELMVDTSTEAVRLSERQNRTELNRQTWECVQKGYISEGNRHRLLYSCAANIAEFKTIEGLAHAILGKIGRDSGLSESEFKRQIDCGLKAGLKKQIGAQ